MKWLSKSHQLINYQRSRQFLYFLIKFFLFLSPIFLFLILYFFSVHIRCSSSFRYMFPVNFKILPTVEKYILGDYIRYGLTYYENGIFTFLALIPYLIHYILPFVFVSVLLYQKRDTDALKYGLIVGFSSIIGFIFQLLIPTAPPWIYKLNLSSEDIDNLQCQGFYGTQIPKKELIHCFSARFKYFEEVFGIQAVSLLFSQNKIIFAAFPSLHICWVFGTVVVNGWGKSKSWIHFLHLFWLTWAVIYSEHHFCIDIIGGLIFVIFVAIPCWYLTRAYKIKSPQKTQELP